MKKRSRPYRELSLDEVDIIMSELLKGLHLATFTPHRKTIEKVWRQFVESKGWRGRPIEHGIHHMKQSVRRFSWWPWSWPWYTEFHAFGYHSGLVIRIDTDWRQPLPGSGLELALLIADATQSNVVLAERVWAKDPERDHWEWRYREVTPTTDP